MNPNPLVKFAWECVGIMLGLEKTDSDSIKKMLADASLMTKMISLDSSSITETLQKKIKAKLLSNPQFKVDTFTAISIAAKSVVKWIFAVVDYKDSSTEVEKKMAHSAQMNSQLEEATKALKEKQDQLAIVQKKVNDLESLLNGNIEAKDKLVNEIQLTSDRLVRAEQLTNGLKDEQERWKEKVLALTEDIKKLIGDVFFAAASICYYGPFTGTFR